MKLIWKFSKNGTNWDYICDEKDQEKEHLSEEKTEKTQEKTDDGSHCNYSKKDTFSETNSNICSQNQSSVLKMENEIQSEVSLEIRQQNSIDIYKAPTDSVEPKEETNSIEASDFGNVDVSPINSNKLFNQLNRRLSKRDKFMHVKDLRKLKLLVISAGSKVMEFLKIISMMGFCEKGNIFIMDQTTIKVEALNTNFMARFDQVGHLKCKAIKDRLMEKGSINIETIVIPFI